MQRCLFRFTLAAATIATLLCWQIPEGQTEITPPPDSNKPPTTTTGRRGNCSSQENPLKAMAPAVEKPLTTAADYPVILVYLPETAATQAQFVLVDGEQNPVYSTMVELPRQSGIWRLSVPPDAASRLGETTSPYRWELAIICDIEDRSGDDWVGGELWRVALSPEIEERLRQANGSDRFSIYQSAGLEYDAIVTLDELLRDNPEDEALGDIWARWLRENGLEDLVGVPLIR